MKGSECSNCACGCMGEIINVICTYTALHINCGQYIPTSICPRVNPLQYVD